MQYDHEFQQNSGPDLLKTMLKLLKVEVHMFAFPFWVRGLIFVGIHPQEAGSGFIRPFFHRKECGEAVIFPVPNVPRCPQFMGTILFAI